MRPKNWPQQTAIPNEDCQLDPAPTPKGDGVYESAQTPGVAPDRSRPAAPRKMGVRQNADFREYLFKTKLENDQVLPGDERRAYLGIQNRGTSAIFISFGGKATAQSFRLVAGGFYEPFVAPTNSLNILGVAADDTVVILEGAS